MSRFETGRFRCLPGITAWVLATVVGLAAFTDAVAAVAEGAYADLHW